MNLKLKTVTSLVISVACITAAGAACLTDEQVARLAQQYAAKAPADNIEGLTDADGACSRAKFNVLLAKQFGKVLGYKAGLTNPAVQKRFSTDQPVWGKLYQGMLLPDGATVEAAFGARPLYEADLLVRVKSADINQAKTALEVLASIDQIIAFIELPDLVVLTPARLNAGAVSAINVGARLGVAGQPVPVPVSPAERSTWHDALRDMTVQITDGTGVSLGQGKGSDLLGHPLNAVLWLSAALAQEGLAMQPGDLISLGSFSALLTPRAGQSASVSYQGLPAAMAVQVNFR